MAGAPELTPLGPADATAADRARIGGKARGLLLLAEANLPTPEWRVWTDEQSASLLKLSDDALQQHIHALGLGERLILRSSAAHEDRADASAAGLYESIVVDNPRDYAQAFRNVATSGDAVHVGTYGNNAERTASIAVIVQRFVAGEHSGVAFSAHPARAYEDAFYIESVDGGAAKLVDGTADPARLEVRFGTLEIIPQPDSPTFPTDALKSIRDGLLALEPLLRSAVDCEWTFAEGRLWFLQARPVTALRLDPRCAPDEPHNAWFFDQRFPEPITPFTRDTLLRRVARVALGDALRMRGTDEPQPELHYYAGRAFAPQRYYEAMLRGAPRWWLSEDLRQIFPPTGRPPGNLLDTLHYAWSALRSVCVERRDVFFNLPAWEQFCADLDRALAQPEPAQNWQEVRAQWERWDTLMVRFLRVHRWSILWADYAHRFVTLALSCLPESTRTQAMEHLFRSVRLKTAEANAALANLPVDPTPSEREAFVKQFGNRSGSLDYAEPTWADLLEDGQLPRPQTPAAERTSPQLPRWPLSLFTRLMELREEQRFRWEQILAAQRSLALRIADRCVADRLLPDRDALWFCTCEDLQALERNEPIDTAVLQRRRHVLWLHRSIAPPQQVGGPEPTPQPGSAALKGLGASPGKAAGRILVCRHADEIPANIAGRILVIRALDPAWTVRVQGCAGLIVERGGLLSHAAIIAREYHIPLVIGVERATELLEDGSLVHIDGRLGTILI